MAKDYICELSLNGNTCTYLMEDEIHCKGNEICTYCGVREIQEQKPIVQTGYVRVERWYEKYYKKDIKQKKTYSKGW